MPHHFRLSEHLLGKRNLLGGGPSGNVISPRSRVPHSDIPPTLPNSEHQNSSDRGSLILPFAPPTFPRLPIPESSDRGSQLPIGCLAADWLSSCRPAVQLPTGNRLGIWLPTGAQLIGRLSMSDRHISFLDRRPCSSFGWPP